MYVICPAPAKLEANLNALPDSDKQHKNAHKYVDKVPKLPVAFEVALGGEEEIAEGHPSKKHPYSMSLILCHSAYL